MANIPGVRPAVQARSRETYNALLGAGRKLLNDRPFSKVSVQEIVDEAGSSAGSFYARFDNKVSFLLAIQDQTNSELRQRMRDNAPNGAPQSVPLREFAPNLTDALVRSHIRNQGLARALLTEGREEPRLTAAAMELVHDVARWAAPVIEPSGFTIEEIESRLIDAQIVVNALLHLSSSDSGLVGTTMPNVYDDGRLAEVFIAATGMG